MADETYLIPVKVTWEIKYDRGWKEYDWRVSVAHETNLMILNANSLRLSSLRLSGNHKDKAIAQKQMDEALINLKMLLGIKENT